ncbi:MAG: glycosyltransferase, partial [Desulfobacterales bacterium]
TATGHWQMGQSPGAPGQDELLQILTYARKLNIPSVFWITRGHEYHSHYKDFASHFDFVFCADPRESELLQDEKIKSDILLPCVQPAIYNPFRHYEHYHSFRLGMLYDGWADLDRMEEELGVLKDIIPYGLDIIESRYQIFRNREATLQDFQESIVGCVSEQSRIQALRYAKAYISLDKTLSTKVTQQWLSLEASASRLPVIHYGSVADDDVRNGAIVQCPDQTDFQMEVVRFYEDDLYRDRMAHLGWRKVFQEHTFSHRIRKICMNIGIDHGWIEYPMVSMVTPTKRCEQLQRCLETYEKQSYPDKELILVYNGNPTSQQKKSWAEFDRDDIKFAIVPGDMFAGACLNQGHIMARGEYLFRVDDDDWYGANYLMDMVLQARSIDAQLFGKPPAPLYFETDQQVYNGFRTSVSCVWCHRFAPPVNCGWVEIQ